MYATTKPLQLHILDYAHPAGAQARLAKACVAEVQSMPVALQAWFGLLLALMAVMGLAALVSLPPGWEVFGTTPAFEWGLMIIGYVFFAIMTSGLCLASSLGTVFGIERFQPFEKRHAILADPVADDGVPDHRPGPALPGPDDLRGDARPLAQSSPMWWMGVFYGAYLVVLLVEVWSMFTPHPKIHQYACTTAAIIAILAPSTLGAVFGVMNAKAFWFGIFTPITMVASAFLAGDVAPGHRVLRRPQAPARGLGALGAHRAAVRPAADGRRDRRSSSALLVRQVVAGLASNERGLRGGHRWRSSPGPLAPLFWARVGWACAPGHPDRAALGPPAGGRVHGDPCWRWRASPSTGSCWSPAGQVAPITAAVGHRVLPVRGVLPDGRGARDLRRRRGRSWRSSTPSPSATSTWARVTRTPFFPWPWIKQHHDHDHEHEAGHERRRRPRRTPAPWPACRRGPRGPDPDADASPGTRSASSPRC